MIDVVLGQAYSKACAQTGSPASSAALIPAQPNSYAWRGEVRSVVGEHGMDLVRDSGDQAAQEVPAGRRATFSCSSTKANFDVRSMATSG
jgi:hypothetical protein